MNMDRREFVKFLALVCAGAAAKPEQIAAFERYYDANTPHTSEEIVCVDEIWASGMATCSTVVRMVFFPAALSGGITLGLNAFGGLLRWYAAPDQKIVIRRRDFVWSISPTKSIETVVGHIGYINQDGVRVNVPLR